MFFLEGLMQTLPTPAKPDGGAHPTPLRARSPRLSELQLDLGSSGCFSLTLIRAVTENGPWATDPSSFSPSELHRNRHRHLAWARAIKVQRSPQKKWE